jgi:hypothetical protein
MDGGQDQDALDRIESAIARIERATVILASRHDALRSRHAVLREAVTESLSDLDALIARQQATGDA